MGAMELGAATCTCGEDDVDNEGYCRYCGGMVLPRLNEDAQSSRSAERSDRRRPRALLPAAALALVVVIVAGLLVVRSGSRHQIEPTAKPAHPAAAEPPGRPLGNSPLAGDIQSLTTFTERVRGLSFTTPPRVRLLDDKGFDTYLAASIASARAKADANERVLRAMGLLKGSVDLEQADQSVSSVSGTSVRYDPSLQALMVRDRPLTPYARTRVVRELTRALDDQHLHIQRAALDARDDEAPLAFSALVEGDAARVQHAFEATLSGPDRAQAEQEQRSLLGAVAASAIPKPLLEILAFPAEAGEPLVGALIHAGGQPRLDAAFAAPPTTSEQVLHPERYLAGEKAKAVAQPTAQAPAPAIGKGSIGELGLRLMFEVLTNPAAAATAAFGWGGDRYVAWHNDFQTCIRINMVMDTPADRAEIVPPLGAWASRQSSATVLGKDDMITVTSCN